MITLVGPSQCSNIVFIFYKLTGSEALNLHAIKNLF